MDVDILRVKQVLIGAKARGSPAEVAAYLAETCGDDAPLRREVERLLREEGRVEPRAPEDTPTIGRECLSVEKPGTVIGHYKLLEKIGEGGCGAVYLAEQQEPIRRRVALKVIKLGMDTKEVIARFEAERQALALMEHPNIAKVLDAGTTEAGRPFFVMELVRGIKITDYCDRNALATEDRLRLFVSICRAIQHAHQKGIIHRDIKPSNILVAVNDGVPTPKVIDFGIAKAIEQPLTDKTLFTAREQFIGTPVYMSPEQAEMSGLDIDTRSDIYSLGVLLYELLTGQTPFPAEELQAAGLEGMRRTIREKEPVRPSTRLRGMQHDHLTPTAKRRRSEPGKLVQSLRGDLDWIVVKALEKDRTRRYATAVEFGEDVERHLRHEPVKAGPPSAVYRLRKFGRRHRMGVAVAGALTLGLLAAVAGTTVAMLRAQRAERAAREEAEKANLINQFLQEILGSANPVEGLDREITVLEALKYAVGKVDVAFAKQPRIAAEVRYTIGVTYLRLGRYADAEPLLQACVQYYEGTPGPFQTNLVEALNTLANLRHEQADYEEAERLYRRALAQRVGQVGKVHEDTLALMSNLSMVLVDKGALDEAEDLCREITETRRQLPGSKPIDLAIDMNNYGRVLMKKKRYVAAEKAYREALGPLKQEKHAHYGLVLGNVGEAMDQQGQSAAALALFQEGLRWLEQSLGEESQDLARLRVKYAFCAMKVGERAEAQRSLQAAIPVLRKSLGDENELTQETLRTLSGLYTESGQADEAEAYRRLLKR